MIAQAALTASGFENIGLRGVVEGVTGPGLHADVDVGHVGGGGAEGVDVLVGEEVVLVAEREQDRAADAIGHVEVRADHRPVVRHRAVGVVVAAAR